MSQLEKIIKNIIMQKGIIGFDEFMQFALYHQKYGYYRTNLQKFGASGDFITASHLSPLFAQVLTKQIKPYLGTGDILEFGAGSGLLALQILKQLKAHNSLPERYYILELSAALKHYQQTLLKKNVPHLYQHCVWLEQLPSNFSGVVIANEVLDAFIAKRFIFAHHNWYELGVHFQQNAFTWQLKKTEIDLGFKPDDGYQTEFNFMIKPWLNALYACIKTAVVILIDYGYSQREYYHPKRNRGTLRCYYRHRLHDNPFIHIGKQDITTSVNFSEVYQQAAALGFAHLGFSTQAHFLLNLGLLDYLADLDEDDKIQKTQAVKQLVLPNTMGETFKVMMFSKNSKPPLEKPLGFCNYDLSNKL